MNRVLQSRTTVLQERVLCLVLTHGLWPARTAGGGGGGSGSGQARASFGNFFTDDTIGIKVSPVRHSSRRAALRRAALRRVQACAFC